MPGLLRGIARTAVVAGTATAVSNRVSRRQYGRWSEQDQQAQQPEEPAGTAASPPGWRRRWTRWTPAGPAPAALGELKAQGVLSESEFAAQQARILGS